MSLFSAEAIFASNTSKFAIWIPLTDDEDLNHPLKSTTSTSLIHSIASVGNFERVNISVLNLIFQQTKVAWLGKFVRMRNLKSAVVVGLLQNSLKIFPHQGRLNFWLTVMTVISDLVLVFGCLTFTHHMRWYVCFDTLKIHGFDFLRLWCWKNAVGFAKTFPGFPCVSQILSGPFLRLGILRERLTIPPGSWWGEKNTGWLVTWDCPLRTDSASWKSLESFIQMTSFCNFWILAVRSRIVSRFSINLLLEDVSNVVSNVEPWNRFTSSMSMREIQNLQSSLVCSIILQRVSLTGDDRPFGWLSRLSSLILNWSSILILLRRWPSESVLLLPEPPWIQFLRIKCCRGRIWICKKRYPIYNVCPKCLAVHLCYPAFPENSLAFRQDLDEVRKTQVDWKRGDCPLRVDSASWKSFESFTQMTSFCNFWIFVVRSRIVFRFSINLLLEDVSNVEPWNRFNSSISLRLFSWASRSSRPCSNKLFMKNLLISSKLSVSLKSTINLTSLRLDNSIQFWDTSSVIIGLELVSQSLLYSQREFAFCVVPKHPDCSFSESRRVFSLTFEFSDPNTSKTCFPEKHERQTTTDLTTSFLQESDKLVDGPLVLLGPEWTVVKRTLCRWCRNWSPSHAGTRAWCRWTPGWKFQWSLRSGSCRWSWAHNLWEGCFRQ